MCELFEDLGCTWRPPGGNPNFGRAYATRKNLIIGIVSDFAIKLVFVRTLSKIFFIKKEEVIN